MAIVFQGYRLVAGSGAMVVVASVGKAGVCGAVGVDGGASPRLFVAVVVVDDASVSCCGRRRAWRAGGLRRNAMRRGRRMVMELLKLWCPRRKR